MKTFEDWIENLPLQTLTDELKQEIIDKFEECNNKILIKELKNYINHPTKPEYKRHDIIARIKTLKAQL